MMAEETTSHVGNVTSSFLIGILALDVLDLIILPKLRDIFGKKTAKSEEPQMTPIYEDEADEASEPEEISGKES